ncbi:chemotaxis protein CheC [Clostridium sp. D2Q-11]|uniref:Chemotaxis protein CheC n=1 Tax=Anaeromonas frigoriresistens TaxID=2683708 RepID=A0A942ZAK8_9FIRM|nr:chemotaxis protein CheC [Anaeromonas frigoriresistens]MBS4539870.1 chemotaxis protein CheC [Anaeromonas frigoriresistens]
MTVDISNLNNILLDVLKELGNIGAGNAATALSQIINNKVDMNVPQVRLLNFSEVDGILGGPENPVVGIYFGMEGDAVGNIMFILDLESAKNLVELLFDKKKESSELNELEISALSEIGNILASSYINSLSQLTSLKLKTSVPAITIDMAGAILSVPAIQFSYVSDKVLFIETEFIEENKYISGNLFLIPDIDSFEIILNSLGVV